MGELTTMSGRRVREALKKILDPIADGNAVVTIAGLANAYNSYTATYEEYQAQRYEAASTIYGPHELEAWIQELSILASDMVAGRESQTDAPPPDNLSKMVELLPPVITDACPIGKSYGDV